MLSNIWEDGVEFVIALIMGCFDKISVLSTYAFSPQLLLFNNYFGGAIPKIYRILLDLSIVIAIILFLSKLTIGIVNPRDRNYESPFELIKGFIKYLVILWCVPVILSFTLSMASTVYWGSAATINESLSTNPITASGGMWSKLQNQLIEQDEEITADAEEDTSDDTEESWQKSRYSQGILAKIVSFILILLLFKEYFFFMVEMAERYVLVGVLTFCSPLAMAPLVSNDTKQITKKYFSMWIGQLLVLIFSVIFLTTFEYGVVSIACQADNYTYIEGGGFLEGKSIGGTYVYLLVMIGFLKLGQKMDTFLNNVGLTVGQTGQGLSTLAGMMISKVAHGALRAASSAAGKAFNSAQTPGTALNTVLSTAGMNPANPDAVQDKARNDVLGAVKDQYKTDDPSKFGKDGEEKYAGSINDKGAADALASLNSKGWQDVADELKNGGYGLEGDLARGYAQSIYQSDDPDNDSKFAIPSGAEIDQAKFDTDGNGSIDYTDEQGNSHHIEVGEVGDDTHPVDGPEYEVQEDRNGNEHYVQDYGNQELADEMQQTGNPCDFDMAASAAMVGLSAEDIAQTRDMLGMDAEGGSMYKAADGTYSAVDKDGNDVATNIKTQGSADYNGGSDDSVRFDNGNGKTVSADIVKERPMQEVQGSFTQDPETGKWRTGSEFSFNQDVSANAAALNGASAADISRLLGQASGSARFISGEGSLKSENGSISAYDKFGNKVADNIRTGSEADYNAARSAGGNSVIGAKMANGQYVMADTAVQTGPKNSGYGLKFNEESFRQTGEKSYSYEHLDKNGQRTVENISYDKARQILQTNHDDVKAQPNINTAYQASTFDSKAYASSVDSAIKNGHFPSGENFERTARAMFGDQLKNYQFDSGNPRNGFSTDGNRMTVIARRVDANGTPQGKGYEKLEFVRGSEAGKTMRSYEKIQSATGDTWCKGETIQQRQSSTRTQQEPAYKKRQARGNFVDNIRKNRENKAAREKRSRK